MAEADERRKIVEADLADRLHEAEKTIVQDQDHRRWRNVRGIATDAASAIVERLLGTKPDSKAVTDAVDQALKR